MCSTETSANESPQMFVGMPALVGSKFMQQLMQTVRRIAQTNAAVLVTGESGSGKEIVARALHHYSLLCNNPWVDVNCGALPEHLVESELFGYEKGAFSGADRAKQGLFELANGGTLFLDEIGELEAKTQVKLLRVLDRVPYYRLGGTRKVAVDVRIIAATNLDLESGISAGKFRSDLYHRLSQFRVHIPPLRERPDDTKALAQYFLQQHCASQAFSHEALEALCAYSWPGNIRELRNVVVQTSTLSTEQVLRTEDLPEAVRSKPEVTIPVPNGRLEEIERQAILRALNHTSGHHRRAAELLGISRRTLTRKLKQYGGTHAFGALATR
jgi:DNA-binding NtrC family response regulator